jgi:oleate hydratase
MRNYDRINAPPPKGIEHKSAHIIGGGIAGLATAAFLVTDADMPAGNVTIYESLPVVGGSMDAAGDAEHGYTCRGERELEAYMECLWYLCGKTPSLQTPGLTILDETHRANIREPIYSHYRPMEKKGQLYDYTGPLMSRHDGKKMLELLMTPRRKLRCKPQRTGSVQSSPARCSGGVGARCLPFAITTLSSRSRDMSRAS